MPFLVFLFLIGLVIVMRVIAGSLDRDRIREEVGKIGGRVVDITWNPFGRGWFGEKGERLYDVTYQTPRGRTVTTSCKTSMWTGVYWTADPMARTDETEPKPASDRHCEACGYALRPGWVACPQCGKKC